IPSQPRPDLVVSRYSGRRYTEMKRTRLVAGLGCALLLAACTGGSSSEPSPRGPPVIAPGGLTALQLTDAVRHATKELRGCAVPIGPTPYGATDWYQCRLFGRPIGFLSFTTPSRRPKQPGVGNG